MFSLEEYLKFFNNIKVIAVTNSKLCRGDFLTQIEKLSKSNVESIILREKTLNEEEYASLAEEVIKICKKNDKELILHNFYNVAVKMNYKKIHLPINSLKEAYLKGMLENFEIVGTSVHSGAQLETAKKCNVNYCTAGHIFVTDCKKGLEPRGTDFLRDICNNADFPVYAIGGINEKNAVDAISSGAAGVCLMSSVMDK